MGYLLKEALKTLCGVNQWSYAVFWKIGCQNPKLLIWEECYYEPVLHSGFPHISGIGEPVLSLDAGQGSAEVLTSHFRVQAGERVCKFVNRLMMDNQVNVVGEGLVGRAAFTGNHQWIVSDYYPIESHSSELLNEVHQQFSAGMQTVAIIPVLPHGVVQLGSNLTIMENIGFVNNVKTLILQLGCVPSSLHSGNYASKDSAPNIGGPVCIGTSFFADAPGKLDLITSSPVVTDSSPQPSGSHSRITPKLADLQFTTSTFQTSNMSESFVESHEDCSEQNFIHVTTLKLPVRSQLKNGMEGAKVMPSNPEALLNKTASFYSRSEFDPCHVGRSATIYDCLTLAEQPVLADSFVQDNANISPSASDAFVMSWPVSNAGLVSSSGNVTVRAPLLEAELHNGMNSHPKSVSDQSSLSNIQLLAKGNISCTLSTGNGESSKAEVPTSDMTDCLTDNQLLPGSFNCRHDARDEECARVDIARMEDIIDTDLIQSLDIPMDHVNEHFIMGEHNLGFVEKNQKHDCENQCPIFENVKFEDLCAQPSSRDDLFDVLGVGFKNKLFNGTWNNVFVNEQGSKTCSLDKDNSTAMKCEDGGWDLCYFNGENSKSGILSVNCSDHLLDAVVSKVQSVSKQSSDYSVSCTTTLTKISSSHLPDAFSSYDCKNVSKHMRGKSFGLSKSPAKDGAVRSCLFRSGSCKDNLEKYSETSSFYGSQLTSWVEQAKNKNRSSSVSSAYSKNADDTSKSNRKRLKPGVNPRPRPKDRQMIQDRVKELRDIVPNGAKCSIDALLERTIKHMLFLQSVTKQADKLKQTEQFKIISNNGGLLPKDNFEGGATWAYEIGSQSMVCPIIVEDLKPPGQMLVEILCEEQGLFLEVADIIRGLGLTIFKGVMETRSDEIWARFVVEANRDVTRMEIFLSLVTSWSKLSRAARLNLMPLTTTI